mgnify:CR=1 FL=1
MRSSLVKGHILMLVDAGFRRVSVEGMEKNKRSTKTSGFSRFPGGIIQWGQSYTPVVVFPIVLETALNIFQAALVGAQMESDPLMILNSASTGMEVSVEEGVLFNWVCIGR